jgi:hypothetical protein
MNIKINKSKDSQKNIIVKSLSILLPLLILTQLLKEKRKLKSGEEKRKTILLKS